MRYFIFDVLVLLLVYSTGGIQVALIFIQGIIV